MRAALPLFNKAVVCLTAVSICFQEMPGYASTPAVAAALPASIEKINLFEVVIPKELGSIKEKFEGRDGKVVFIIQDAHAIPDAQRNIQKLIEFSQKKHGIRLVALEGAASDLDAQIFRSFPDKELLKNVFEQYFDRGELTGGTAAAIFSRSPSVYHGIEDWALYEKGLGHFLEAMEMETEITAELEKLFKQLETEKQGRYSEKLLAIDRSLREFQRDASDLVNVLEKLAAVMPPPEGSELALLLEEAGRSKTDSAPVEVEVKNIAEQIRAALSEKKISFISAEDVIEFNQKFQQFRTSQLSPETFALFMKSVAVKHKIRVRVSKGLNDLVGNQKRMKDIEGTRLFTEFESYAGAVKETLFQSREERFLDARGYLLELMNRLSKLELSVEDWNELKGVLAKMDAFDLTQDGIDSRGDAARLLRKMKAHIEFYDNAEHRDRMFMSQTEALFKKYSAEAAVLVAGGFHAQGLTYELKAKGLSYVLIMPAIESLPEENRYRAHMRGEVTWGDYFEIENGRVNLYSAFVRGTRDFLLNRSEEDRGRLLKLWRDSLIRDLAGKNKITEAERYTGFIDEILDGAQNDKEDLISKWRTNIDRFLSGLGKLQGQNRITEENVLNLLTAATTGDAATYAGLAMRSDLRVELLPGLPQPSARSELRSLSTQQIASLEAIIGSYLVAGGYDSYPDGRVNYVIYAVLSPSGDVSFSKHSRPAVPAGTRIFRNDLMVEPDGSFEILGPPKNPIRDLKGKVDLQRIYQIAGLPPPAQSGQSKRKEALRQMMRKAVGSLPTAGPVVSGFSAEALSSFEKAGFDDSINAWSDAIIRNNDGVVDPARPGFPLSLFFGDLSRSVTLIGQTVIVQDGNRRFAGQVTAGENDAAVLLKDLSVTFDQQGLPVEKRLFDWVREFGFVPQEQGGALDQQSLSMEYGFEIEMAPDDGLSFIGTDPTDVTGIDNAIAFQFDLSGVLHEKNTIEPEAGRTFQKHGRVISIAGHTHGKISGDDYLASFSSPDLVSKLRTALRLMNDEQQAKGVTVVEFLVVESDSADFSIRVMIIDSSGPLDSLGPGGTNVQISMLVYDPQQGWQTESQAVLSYEKAQAFIESQARSELRDTPQEVLARFSKEEAESEPAADALITTEVLAEKTVESLRPDQTFELSRPELRQIAVLAAADLKGLTAVVQEAFDRKLKELESGSETDILAGSIELAKRLVGPADRGTADFKGIITFAINFAQTKGRESFFSELLKTIEESGFKAEVFSDETSHRSLARTLNKGLSAKVSLRKLRSVNLSAGSLVTSGDMRHGIPLALDQQDMSAGLSDSFLGLLFQDERQGLSGDEVYANEALFAAFLIKTAKILGDENHQRILRDRLNAVDASKRGQIRAAYLKEALVAALREDYPNIEAAVTQNDLGILTFHGALLAGIVAEFQARSEMRKSA